MQSRKSRFTRSSLNSGAVILIVLVFALGAFAKGSKPTVTFTGAPTTAANGATFTVATTTNDGTTAAITVAGACSGSGSGTAVITMTENSGTCTMTASWPASGNYLAAKATQKTTATTGYAESDIYYFTANYSQNGDDGWYPAFNGMVFDKDGNIFASTGKDINNLAGAIVELSPAGGGVWNETLVHVFDRYSPSFSGWGPTTLAMDSKGNLYGTTEFGGGTFNPDTGEYPCGGSYGCGTVYELSKNADGVWTATDLYNFGTNANDGVNPVAGVTLGNTSATVLYGTAKCGGTSQATLAVCAGAGTIYELTKEQSGSWQETVLYDFPATGTSEGPGIENDPNGAFPTAGLLLKDGNLYGTTSLGGINASGDAGIGALFELSPGTGGWTINQLYVFCTNSSAPDSCPEGGVPGDGTVTMDSQDNLYGTTGTETLNEPSTVWELPYSSTTKSYAKQVEVVFSQYHNPAPPSVGLWVVPYKKSLFVLGFSGTSGSYPYYSCCGELVELTNSAKTGWQATPVYQFPPSGVDPSYTTLWGFNNQMIVDKNGNFYSMATYGGPGAAGGQLGYGGVLEISPLP
jgi:hypothetical protein